MKVLKSIVRRLSSRQVRPARSAGQGVAGLAVLTSEQLKQVAGGLPRAGTWAQAEEVAAALPRDA